MQQVWQIRQMMALAMLAVCTFTDIKERNIYIVPLLIPSAAAAVITVISYITAEGAFDTQVLFEYILLPVSAGMILIAVTGSLKDHIGEGDALLCAALFIVIGVTKSLYVIMIGSVAAAFYAAAVIISKKRESIRTVPFAPFMMTGFMVILMDEIL